MKTRYFLFGTEDTMYNFEEGNVTEDSLDLYETLAYDESELDVTDLMQYVVDYGYYVEINEEMFNKIINFVNI